MKRNQKAGNTIVIDEATVTIEGGTPEVTVTETAKQLGRPVNPTSARQIRLAEQKSKHGGFVRLGRPVKAESKRQQKLSEIDAKKKSGVVAKKGRPVMTEEEKEVARAKRQAAYEMWLENEAKTKTTAE